MRRLAAEGAYVVFNYRTSEGAAKALVAEVQAAGGRAFAVRADVASAAEVAWMFAACDEVLGAQPHLDILVNNAGVGNEGRDGHIERVSEELIDEQLSVNVKGPLLVTQAALRRVRDNGRVVNIGSLSGKSSQHFSASYAMTKRAIQSLTFSTATIVAKRGITCNCIAPGAVATEFIAALRAKPGWDEAAARNTPMGRIGQPDDIAGAVLMLCREEAGWVTGNVIEAAGGLAL